MLTKPCCELNVGENLGKFTFFPDSGLLNGFYFYTLIYFEWCDAENFPVIVLPLFYCHLFARLMDKIEYPEISGTAMQITIGELLEAKMQRIHASHLMRANIIVIPPKSNTFLDWRRTCHVPLVKTQ